MTDTATFKTPFAELLPPLSTQELDDLRQDITANGVRVPIMVMFDPDGSFIVDGHHRALICRELGVTPPVQYVDEAWPEALAIKMNVNRRNLSADQRANVRNAQMDVARRMAAEGVSEATIGAVIGVSRQTVNSWVSISSASTGTTNNQPERPKAKPGPKPKPDLAEPAAPVTAVRIPKSEHATIADRHAAGETQTQIAADYKVAQGRIAQIVDAERKRAELVARNTDLAAEAPAALEGDYDVIVIDPPWTMTKIDRDVAPGQVAFDYPTMNEEELAAMNLPAADDCHVWVWTTHKHLPMAMRLLDSWGLKYVCTFVWHKPGGFQPYGLPQYNCEFALYARKGTPQFATTKAFPVCFNAPRTEHSAKPAEFYDTVRRCTSGRRIDIFNRRPIDGFESWGNEAAR
jgi:N6-adenosine-specific RNA methylase IME4